MAPKNKPAIVFLTSSWSNIDENIRKGKQTGGTASIVRGWASCLANGFGTHVFIMCQHDRDWPKQTEYLDGIQIHWVSEPFRRTANWFRRKGLIGLCKPLSLIWQMQMLYRVLTSRIKPDIIYCMRPTYLIAGCLLKCVTKAKLVWRMYGSHNVYDAWFGRKGWLTQLKHIGALMAYRFPVDLLITTNDGTRGDRVAQWAGFPMERHRFWLNGVNKSLRVSDFDAASFKQNLGFTADTPMILMIGRLCEFKRVDRMIDAMPEILKSIPEAHLVLVGSGELREELEKLTKALQLNDKVIFTGSVANEEIWKYLNAADIFVIVNIGSNLSATLIEAMAAGCCIVTADVGGTSDIAIDGVNCILLDDPAPLNIAHAIVQLLKNPQQRVRLSEGAYKYAMENFQTWDERMQMEVDELKRLLTPGESGWQANG